MHKLMSRTAFGLTAFTVLLGVVLSTTVPKAAAETSAQTTASVMVSSSCSLTADEETPHTATLANGVYSGGTGLYPNGIGKTILTAFCNNAAGFAIYAVGYSGSPGTYGNNTMVGSATGIPIGTGIATTGNTSQWAMKVSKINDATAYNPENLTITNGFDDYHAVPSVYEKVADFSSNTDATLGSKMTTTYAVYISPTQAADTYVGKVKYTLVHPQAAMAPSILSEYGIFYMQDFAKLTPVQLAEVKDAMVIGEKALLTDIRDGNVYYVGKLADGNIWLLDNLALDLTDRLVVGGLSSANTNATDISLDYLRNGGGTASDRYPIEPLRYENWVSGRTYSTPLVKTNLKDASYTDDSLSDEAKTWKYGIYYNYCAASAGSYCNGSSASINASEAPIGNATEDICPKGWRMQTRDEAKRLYEGNYGYGTINTYRKALRLPLSGYVSSGQSDSGSVIGIGSNSGYWFTSTRNDLSSMYYMGLNSFNSGMRYGGSPIRCILDINHSQTIVNVEYMQDVTSEIVANTQVNATATMIDRRDGTKYTVGKLADGHLWLLDNLALDLTNAAVVSNMDSTNTNASDTTLARLRGSTYSNWTSGSNYFMPLVNTTYKDNANVSDSLSGATGWKFGIYYNYCAASAYSYCYSNSGHGNNNEDICPKGWRLPSSNGSNSDYGLLYYGGSGYNTADTYRAALHLPLSGTIDSVGGAVGQGSTGGWWSQTASNGDAMYSLSVGTIFNASNGTKSRNLGASVRCIFRP